MRRILMAVLVVSTAFVSVATGFAIEDGAPERIGSVLGAELGERFASLQVQPVAGKPVDLAQKPRCRPTGPTEKFRQPGIYGSVKSANAAMERLIGNLQTAGYMLIDKTGAICVSEKQVIKTRTVYESVGEGRFPRRRYKSVPTEQEYLADVCNGWGYSVRMTPVVCD